MTGEALVGDAAHLALLLVLKMAAPVVLPVLGAALLVGLVQAATSINEATLSFVPKIVVGGVCLALFGAVMMRLLTDFTIEIFSRIPLLLR